MRPSSTFSNFMSSHSFLLSLSHPGFLIAPQTWQAPCPFPFRASTLTLPCAWGPQCSGHCLTHFLTTSWYLLTVIFWVSLSLTTHSPLKTSLFSKSLGSIFIMTFITDLYCITYYIILYICIKIALPLPHKWNLHNYKDLLIFVTALSSSPDTQ